MKPFATAIQYIKDIEKMDKFEFAELTYNEANKQWQKKFEALKSDIELYESSGSNIRNQRCYDFFVGMVSAYNVFLESEEKKMKVNSPPEDVNGEPMWFDELTERIKG